MTNNNVNAGQCTLRVYHKQHAAQESAPYLGVHSNKPKAEDHLSEHCHWTVEHLPKEQVAFKGHNGHYLAINSHGQFHMSGSRSHESHFHLVKDPTAETDPRCVAIKEPHGGFLTFDAHGHLSVKKGLSETENPAALPWFLMEEKGKTAHKEQHHGHHHHH